MEAMKQSLAEDIELNKVDTVQQIRRAVEIQKVANHIDQLKNAQQEAVNTTRKLRDAFGDLKKSIDETKLKKLYDQFWRLVKLRALRYIIKQISAGFSEGVQNVYQYSKAVGGAFYQSMDAATTVLNQMKNSIGAAAAPLIQEFIPYLQMAVNWLINIINYLNQFFALLRGQTSWTHALATDAGALDDVASSASGASAAMKDLLADWDELNIIQSKGGSGGGGSGTDTMEDYLNMFEEVTEFDHRVRAIVDFIKENFETIKKIVLTIGAAMLAWKLTNTFISALGAFGVAEDTLKNISSMLKKGIAGTALLTIGAIFGWEAGKELAEDGITGDAIIKEITSLVATAVGGYLVAGKVGVVAGVTISIISTILGYISQINLEKNEEYATLAKKSFESANGNVDIDEYKKALEKEFEERLGGLTPVIDAFSEMPTLNDNITTALLRITTLQNKLFGAGKLTKAEADEFKSNWEIVTSTLASMKEVTFETIDLGIGEMISNANEEAKTELIKLRATFKELSALEGGTLSEMKYEMDQILARQTDGTLTDEERAADLEKYQHYLNVVAAMSKSELSALESLNSVAEGFDFSTGEGEFAENATAFVKDLGAQLDDANGKVDEWEKTQLSALEWSRQLLTAQVNEGILDADIAQPYIDAIDSAKELVEKHAEKIRQENQESIDDALETVMKQILFGYEKYINSGGEADQYYKYVDSLMDALETAGYQIPDQFQQMQSRNNGHLSLLEWGLNLLGFNTTNGLNMEDVRKFLYGGKPEEVVEAVGEAANELGVTAAEEFSEPFETVKSETEDNVFEPLIDKIVSDGEEIPAAVEKVFTNPEIEETIRGAFSGDTSIWNYADMFSGHDSNDIATFMRNWAIDQINQADSELGAYLEKNNINPFEYMTDDMRKNIEGYMASTLDTETARRVLEAMFPSFQTEIESFLTSLTPSQYGTDGSGAHDFGDVMEEQANAMEAAAEVAQNKTSKIQEELSEQLINAENWMDAESLQDLADYFGLSIEDMFDTIAETEITDELRAKLQAAFDEINKTTEEETVTIPAVDHRHFDLSLKEVRTEVDETVKKINELRYLLDGVGVSPSGSNAYNGNTGIYIGPHYLNRASGGYVRSGDLVMANENGNFEMMGRMGNQPVVANNQMIVSGISQGVSNANGDVVSELRTLATMMQRMLAKEWVAKAVPGSTWGSANKKSAEAYSKVTG